MLKTLSSIHQRPLPVAQLSKKLTILGETAQRLTCNLSIIPERDNTNLILFNSFIYLLNNLHDNYLLFFKDQTVLLYYTEYPSAIFKSQLNISHIWSLAKTASMKLYV